MKPLKKAALAITFALSVAGTSHAQSNNLAMINTTTSVNDNFNKANSYIQYGDVAQAANYSTDNKVMVIGLTRGNTPEDYTAEVLAHKLRGMFLDNVKTNKRPAEVEFFIGESEGIKNADHPIPITATVYIDGVEQKLNVGPNADLHLKYKSTEKYLYIARPKDLVPIIDILAAENSRVNGAKQKPKTSASIKSPSSDEGTLTLVSN